jgi:hypothetical protein
MENNKAMWDAGQDNIFIDICLEEIVARNIGFGRCLNTVGFSNLEAKFNAQIVRSNLLIFHSPSALFAVKEQL